MQEGLENVPFYLQQSSLSVYPSQGINIFLSPSLSINPNQSFIQSNPLVSLGNEQGMIISDKIEHNNTTNNIIFSPSNNIIETTNIINKNDLFNGNSTNKPKDDEKANPNEETEEDNEGEEDEEEDENENVPELSDDQISLYKSKIEGHPLYGLLSLLFERCEQSTQSGIVYSSKSIDTDIVNYFLKMNESYAVNTSDEEVDDLMQKSIEVLKIHMIELEKVQELCKNFCSRYITNLKASLHPSQLVQIEADDEYDMLQLTGEENAPNTTTNPPKTAFFSQTPLGLGQVVSGGTVYQMVQTPQGLVAQPIQISPQLVTNQTNMNNKSCENVFTASDPQKQFEEASNSSGTYSNTGHKKGVLPKKATKVMKTWLFQHLSHPYPTEDEKRQIANQTNLTILQVNNWFINGRRRILQPMMSSLANADNKDDANNNALNAAINNNKTKSKRNVKKVPKQKFWSDTYLSNNDFIVLGGELMNNNNSDANISSVSKTANDDNNANNNTYNNNIVNNKINNDVSCEIKSNDTDKANNKICKVYTNTQNDSLITDSNGKIIECPDEDDNDDEEDDDETDEGEPNKEGAHEVQSMASHASGIDENKNDRLKSFTLQSNISFQNLS